MARRDGVIAEQHEDSVILYDLDALRYYRLDTVTARVWRLADGERTVGELATAAGVGEASIRAAVSRLASCGMLAVQVAAPRRAAIAAWA